MVEGVQEEMLLYGRTKTFRRVAQIDYVDWEKDKILKKQLQK